MLHDMIIRPLAITVFFLLNSQLVWAVTPPCQPCAGVKVGDPTTFAPLLAEAPRIEGEARLYIAWDVELDGSADPAAAAAILAAGGTPWMVLQLRTPAPIEDNIAGLERELKEVARLARSAGKRTHYQLAWPGGDSAANPKEYSFLLKRAAVAVTGAQPGARVISAPMPADNDSLKALYSEEVAAYLDGIALLPSLPESREAAIATLSELDPGKPIILDTLSWPKEAAATLARAAEAAQAGFSLTFFAFDSLDASDLAPLKVLAREFQGDLSFDPYSLPTGSSHAWSFVRGSDLGLRVIVEGPGDGSDLSLLFSDSQLKRPSNIDLSSGESSMIFGQRRSSEGLKVPLEEAPIVSLLSLERQSAAELEGVEEQLTVADERWLPVEEILRRLQAFEDAQARRLDHYEATNTQHLRFRLGSGLETLEASFQGDFFFQRGRGFDWAWQKFFLNGVQWKEGRKLPEIPLIQPEKAAALPLEINFTKDYSYRLRGRATIAGRDCWVVDFEPLEVEPGSGLHQGSVWIDREIFARVQTRALQVGLEGEVLSNEETVTFSPVDADGQSAAWDASSYFLPLRIVGQQLLSLLNTSTQVEKETLLTEIKINGETFERRRKAAYESEATMVRDTQKGLRYLEKTEEGIRVVKEGFDNRRIFAIAGVFHDESLDFPLPLAGINYLDLDFRGSGNQVNIFFAGALLTANIAEPRLFGSRWDAGANIFGFFLPTDDEFYRGGNEVTAEAVESSNARISFFLGHPIGNFSKLDFTFGLLQDNYGRADDTAEDFVIPEDTLTQSLQTDFTYSRSGWRFAASGSFNRRDDWQPWGLPGNLEFDPEQEDYILWNVSLAKTWWLPKFTKLGISLEHLDGEDLDRFSKYDFSFFSASSVAGYQSGLVRASKADGLHLSYGLNLGNIFRVELQGDAVLATDEDTNLEDELLAGIGLEGTTRGPWGTLMNFEVGVPVDGPGDGFTANIVFLKLFR